MTTHRRLRVFDQVECTVDLDPAKRLYFEKGKRYVVCEVLDPEPLHISFLSHLILGLPLIPEDEYGIRLMGTEYPQFGYSRASDFKLVGVESDKADPEKDRVSMLYQGKNPFSEDESE